MKTIWKYLLDSDNVVLSMPSGADILSVQTQNDGICLWARVSPDAPATTRRFRIAPTGRWIDFEMISFLGTVQQFNGSLVWHIFEVEP